MIIENESARKIYFFQILFDSIDKMWECKDIDFTIQRR